MSAVLDFQSMILALQKFWAEQGCLIWQPYYAQVGAGTMNPATALRVLGPEPWKVAYVEPSIRPDDGRYGENPNRMQMHYQLQVILKPDPGNPQEIYLQSLQAVGIDPLKHDIRFVEDNWASPPLGAWGVGWEVWLDGQEITQYTYFQQSGGVSLDPISVEITYGLDRIAIALQRVHGFTEIRWNEALTSGDLNLQAEQEHSRYYFETADVDRLRQMYDLFEAEGEAALAQSLVLPAYDYLLKCSHTFNVLDTRGAVGVTERQVYFGRMRALARRVAEAYLEQRQRLEYPFMDQFPTVEVRPGRITSVTKPAAPSRPAAADSPAAFLLEIGTEELPVGDLDSALTQLRQRVPDLLEELRLEHGDIRVMGTPRRLVVFVEELAGCQQDSEQVVKGPPTEQAFDSLNQPTKAAEGFARSKGVRVSDLQVREMDGGQYVVAVVREIGRPTREVLAETLPELLASLRFDKSMRWNSSNVTFSRPIRWLLALLGEEVVQFSYASLVSGNVTRGLRFHEPETFLLHNPQEYFTVLAEQGLVLDMDERKQLIRRQVEALANQVNGTVEDDPALMAEVTNLVEAPAGVIGSFDVSYLELPREVLIAVMKKHQRYFPVERQGRLLPYFIAIANHANHESGDGDLDLIVEGNEHVIRARFADAAFFINEDLKRPLEDYLDRLDTLTFQVDLGSMLDKTQRLQKLVEAVAPRLGLDSQEIRMAQRAAQLCKADLTTKMVVEMTSLQGLMGRFYASRSDEPAEVADAIFEHFLPRFSGDPIPTTKPGLAVGVVDRLDTLLGLIAAGITPTGTKDPYALRRAALGLVGNLIGWDIDFDLRAALVTVAKQLPIPAGPEKQNDCLSFIAERLRNLFLEQGYRYDVIDAVVAAQGHNPAGAARALTALTAWVGRLDWHTILPAYARCVRITRDQLKRFPVDSKALVEPEEQDLFNALEQAENAARQLGSVDDFLHNFLPMIPAIDNFFDEVLVMTEERKLRENRLGLLQRVTLLAEGVADLSRLEGF